MIGDPFYRGFILKRFINLGVDYEDTNWLWCRRCKKEGVWLVYAHMFIGSGKDGLHEPILGGFLSSFLLYLNYNPRSPRLDQG